jgi:AcrR family transcriptional regulator
MTTGSRRPGRPPTVDAAALTAAVLAIGFDEVTVPRVAAHLGVTTATVYRHVADRHTLLARAWDHVAAGIAWPTTGPDQDWEQALRDHARVLDEALAAHPGVVGTLAGTVLPPASTRVLLDLTALLHRAGFTPDDAVLVVDTVIDLVVEHRGTTERLDGPRRTPPDPDAAPAPAARDDLAATWPTGAPGTDARSTDDPRTTTEDPLVAAWRTAVRTDPARWLDRRLDLVLTGARTLLPPGTPSPTDRPATS